MKIAIHPKYFDASEIRCSCGTVFTVGSTKEKLKTELCSHCHPFYTGQQKLVDTAGRVDKFQARRKKSADLAEEAKKRTEEKKKKPAAYEEKVIPAEVLERAMTASQKDGKWEGPVGDAPAVTVLKEEVAEAKAARTAKAKAKNPVGKKASAKKATTKKTRAKKSPAKKGK